MNWVRNFVLCMAVPYVSLFLIYKLLSEFISEKLTFAITFIFPSLCYCICNRVVGAIIFLLSVILAYPIGKRWIAFLVDKGVIK